MRSDMCKVVTERPRRGHANKSKKTAKRLSKNEFPNSILFEDDSFEDIDGGSNRHPVSRRGQYGYAAKEFSDLIGPLRGYLTKQVGRPWNKVYSEMSKSLDKRTVSGRHIWTHVDFEVEKHCEVREDGKIYQKQVRRYNSDHPIEGLYVHPETGILCNNPKVPWRKRFPESRYTLKHQIESFGFEFEDQYQPLNLNQKKKSKIKFDESEWILIDDLRHLQRIPETNSWFLYEYKKLDPEQLVFSHMEKEKPIYKKLKEFRGKNGIYKERVSVRQIGRRDKELWKLCQSKGAE